MTDGDGVKSNYKWWLVVILPVWVFSGFLAAQLFIVGLFHLLVVLGLPLASIDQDVLTAVVAALLYLVTLGLVIGLPWLVKKYQVSLRDIGLDRLPTWTDILMAPVGLIVYLVASGLLIMLATALFPSFNVAQAQNTGFGQLHQSYEYILAFSTLVIIGPFAEEILFRGYLFGKLKRFVPIWAAILATSLLFGFVHGAWNLAIDTFALSVVMCLLRQNTGSLWTSILLHMTKNGIAFYVLFINPTLLSTLLR